MSARRSALARLDVDPARVAFEEAARLSLAGARPSLDDILSVWPLSERARLILWVLMGPGLEITIAARFRDHALEGASRELFRGLRRIRDDIPVVVERDDGRTVVVPLRRLTTGT